MNETRFCSACGASIDAAARFCNQCGYAVAQPGAPAVAAPQKSKWYHNPAFVLFMLFVVLQVFGLPLVWKNPRFTRPTKILLTALTILETVVLTVLTLGAVQTIVHSMMTENSDLKNLFTY